MGPTKNDIFLLKDARAFSSIAPIYIVFHCTCYLAGQLKSTD